MDADGLNEYIKAFMENTKRTGRLEFDVYPETTQTPAVSPAPNFCRGEAYLIAKVLVDTGFIRGIPAEQFITIVEIIYQLQKKNVTGQII